MAIRGFCNRAQFTKLPKSKRPIANPARGIRIGRHKQLCVRLTRKTTIVTPNERLRRHPAEAGLVSGSENSPKQMLKQVQHDNGGAFVYFLDSVGSARRDAPDDLKKL
jgi:hypothetical protein